MGKSCIGSMRLWCCNCSEHSQLLWPLIHLFSRPLKYIRLRTVPVLQDSCIVSLQRTQCRWFLSLQEGMSLMRYAVGEADRGQYAEALRALKVQQVHTRQGKDGKVCRWKRPSQGLLLAWNHKLPGLNQPQGLAYSLHHNGDVTFGGQGPNHQI